MCDDLVINPNNLYNIYDHKQIKIYYAYSFLPKFKSIDIEILYDILNCLSLRDLKALNKYVYKQISLLMLIIENIDEELDINSIKRKKSIERNVYTCTDINSSEELNDKLSKFIDDDKILALVIINKLLIFLYPY